MHHNYAFDYVEKIIVMSLANEISVLIEDARKRGASKYYAAATAQGAGAIKVICSLWQEWARHKLSDQKRVSVYFIKPLRGGTKWNAKKFKDITKWDKRTNEHQRDAGVIAFTYNSKLAKIAEL